MGLTLPNSMTSNLRPSKISSSQLRAAETTTLEAVRIQRCKNNYFEFFKEFWDTVCPEKLIVGWYHKVICDELQTIGGYIIRREIPPFDYWLFNVPPGTSKSTMISQLWPVWLWINDPTIRIITTSYSFQIAEINGSKSKDCINSQKFQEWYGHLFSIRHDINNKSAYATDKMGKRMITSSGGSVTGMHADVIIPDDPHKVPDPEKEIAGATAVEMASDVRWNFSSLESRKTDENRVPIVVVMQRVSEKDLSGAILNKSETGEIKVRHIKLPATLDFAVNPPELSGQYIDGILDPIRKGRGLLAKKKVSLGSYGFAGQYGQDPAPPEGGIIKKTWFKYFKRHELPETVSINFYCDTAYTEKATNDPSCIVAYTSHNNNLYILGVSVVRKDFPDFCRHLIEYVNSMGYADKSRIYIEPKASGISIYQQLRQMTGMNVVLDKFPGGMTDKINRVEAQTAKIEAGRVYLLEDAHWIEAFLTECGMFPNGAHDDQVDCLTGAMRKGFGSGIDYSGFR